MIMWAGLILSAMFFGYVLLGIIADLSRWTEIIRKGI